MNILVLGGYGFIGLPVVLRLLEAGHKVIGLGRSVRSARVFCPEATWVEKDIASLTDSQSWLPILSDVEIVVNCSGALQDGPRDNLQALQSDAMKALFAACRIGRMQRIVQVSAAGVSSEASTPFFQTKAEADAALMASGLDWIILRPGLVIARSAYGGTALIRALASFPCAIPIIGGKQLIQSVGVDDVANAVLASVERHIASCKTYDLVEEKPHSLQELILAFRSWLGYAPAPFVRVPTSIGRIVFKFADALSFLGWRSPLRTTVSLQLEVGVRGDGSVWLEEGGRAPSGLFETLRRSPSTVQERWFARLWLMKPVVIAALSLFWFLSGLIGFIEADQASMHLLQRGIGEGILMLAVLGGSVLDICLALMLLVRVTHKTAALGMIAMTLAYLSAGTLLTPELWLDPLGPFVKTIPCAVLALVALAIAEER